MTTGRRTSSAQRLTGLGAAPATPGPAWWPPSQSKHKQCHAAAVRHQRPGIAPAAARRLGKIGDAFPSPPFRNRLSSVLEPILHKLIVHNGHPRSMPRVRACPLPQGALLSRYSGNGAWLDCYVTSVAADVDLARYIEAFYTGRPFRIERQLLQWFAGYPSTDDDVRRLANGARRYLSAWRVEDRTVNQLLMIDASERTRSWLMVETAPERASEGPAASAGSTSSNTRLLFGSAVLPAIDRHSGRRRIGPGLRSLIGFHGFYSRALLGAAASRLEPRRGA